MLQPSSGSLRLSPLLCSCCVLVSNFGFPKKREREGQRTGRLWTASTPARVILRVWRWSLSPTARPLTQHRDSPKDSGSFFFVYQDICNISQVLIYVFTYHIIIITIVLNIWICVRLQQGGNLLFHWIILMLCDPPVCLFVISCYRRINPCASDWLLKCVQCPL